MTIPFNNNRLLQLLFIVFISFSSVLAQDTNVVIDSIAVQKGEQIFKANCTACHVMGDKKLIGPGLLGVTDRRTKEWLKKWINSSSDFIASGDADAIAIYEEYNKVAMPSYYFEDTDYEAVYAYLQNPPLPKVIADAGDLLVSEDEGLNISTQLMFIALFLLLLVYVLTSLKNKLKDSLAQDTETITQTLVNQFNLFISNNRNIVFVAFACFIVVVKFGYDSLSSVGIYTKYQPEQPIAFSHKVHAGENGVDCNY